MHLTNALKDIYDYFKSIPNSTWYSLALVVGASTLVSGVLQTVKHYFTVTEKKRVIALLTGLSLIASYLANFIQFGTVNNHFLGDYTLQIVGVATLLYHYLTSPLYKKLVGYVSRAEGVKPPTTPEAPSAPVTGTDLVS